MLTLIVDNYDSFTYNLFQCIGEVNGEAPIVVKNDALSADELLRLDFDNIVISPGPGHPGNRRDFGVCKELILRTDKPLLGVCLGCQGIAAAFGGRVVAAREPVHGRTSPVHSTAAGLFRGLPSPLRAVRYHSLCVAEPLPACLRRTAWSEDGVLMGLEHVERPLHGVQFHPESVSTEDGMRLLRNFRDLTHARRSRRSSAMSRPPAESAPNPEKYAARVVHRKWPLQVGAEAVFVALFADSPIAFWLDSSRVISGLSRFSFLGGGEASEVLRYSSRERMVEVRRNGILQRAGAGIFDFLRERLERHELSEPALPFDFLGGFVGWFGYELKAECGGQAVHASLQPDAAGIWVQRFLAVDHSTQEIYAVAVCLSAEEEAVARGWLDEMERRLDQVRAPPPPRTGHDRSRLRFELERSGAQYVEAIGKALEYIRAGESYEVCLTNRIHADFDGDALDLYRVLRQINPAPFAAYLRLGELAVLCSSPERFLRVDRGRRVEAKPIKGTAPRGASAEHDRHIAAELAASEKNRAENLMIVDLLRNDLGRVCDIGSVRVPLLMGIESYATVHQMVSTITGQLRRDVHVLDCLRAAFPGGSMTGAPKIRTMEILDRLEASARGIYSGALGYLSLNGCADLNVVIRTLVTHGGVATIGVGGAVVALSDPRQEFDETLLKAKALLDALALYHRGDLEGAPYDLVARPQ